MDLSKYPRVLGLHGQTLRVVPYTHRQAISQPTVASVHSGWTIHPGMVGRLNREGVYLRITGPPRINAHVM